MKPRDENPLGEQALASLASDRRLAEAIRGGSEEAFVELVTRLRRPMLRLAEVNLRSRSIAEEVLQETWIRVLRGIARYEGRASLRSWIGKILMNAIRARARKEGRTVSLGSIPLGQEPSVDPGEFNPPDATVEPNHWARFPTPWTPSQEDVLLMSEARDVVMSTVARLPEDQRQVILLRDSFGWSSGEVCETLDISTANQRVLLHRARMKVRKALLQYLEKDE
jgi:RNA polymerase sigma-70 factor (ECF subfamily)